MPISYGRQYIDENDIRQVVSVLQSDYLTQGPMVDKFEAALAEYYQCRYAIVFSNGTAALHGAYFAAGLGPGQCFITTTNTFVASANGGVYLGARPVLCDIDPQTYNIDVQKALTLANNTKNVKAVTPVTYAGYPAIEPALFQWAEAHNAYIIHDASHGAGAKRDGNNILACAHMATLSFHPVKHVATGEGGAVLTNDPALYHKLKLFRTHGILKAPEAFINKEEAANPWYYEMQTLGYNYRLTDIQCALGVSQMEKLNWSLCNRNRIAAIYDRELESIPWITPPYNPFGNENITEENIKSRDSLHAYHLYPVQTPPHTRLDLFQYLREKGIYVQVHYIPVHYMPYYARFGYKKGDFPIGETFYHGEISLPMYPTLTDKELDFILCTLRAYKPLPGGPL